MTAPPKRRSPAFDRQGSDHCGDRQHLNLKLDQAQTAVRLAYSRDDLPAWMQQIERHPDVPSPRPTVRWLGNVAKVGFRPLGFGLVEMAPGEWALAWRTPSTCRSFSDQGADLDTARAALEELRCEVCRPIYPPLPLRRFAA